MVGMINDALGTDINLVYTECPLDGYVYDVMADYSTFREVTGWEPEVDFQEGVERVRAPYREGDASGTKWAGRDSHRTCDLSSPAVVRSISYFIIPS
jgi:hypothetical protein